MNLEQLSKKVGVPILQLSRQFIRSNRRAIRTNSEGDVLPGDVKLVLAYYKDETPIQERFKMAEVGIKFNAPPSIIKKLYRDTYGLTLPVDSNNTIDKATLTKIERMYARYKV